MSVQKPVTKRDQVAEPVIPTTKIPLKQNNVDKALLSKRIDKAQFSEQDINGNYSLRSNYKFVQNNLMNI